jgi:hypothetical protein
MSTFLSFSKSGTSSRIGLGSYLDQFATTLRADFRFGPLNALLLIAIFVAGLVVHLSLYTFTAKAVLLFMGSGLVLAMILRVSQVWEAAVILGTADCLAAYLHLRPESEVLLASVATALLAAPSVQIAYQWERAVVLRFGRFQSLRRPGIFLMVPVIDKVARFVDQRIRVTGFSAETTLTSDTVPVNVDAIAFWMVWDAQKAVLEVECFEDAVVFPRKRRCAMPSAKTIWPISSRSATGWGARSRKYSTRRPRPGESRPRRWRSGTLSFPRGWKTP